MRTEAHAAGGVSPPWEAESAMESLRMRREEERKKRRRSGKGGGGEVAEGHGTCRQVSCGMGWGKKQADYENEEKTACAGRLEKK